MKSSVLFLTVISATAFVAAAPSKGEVVVTPEFVNELASTAATNNPGLKAAADLVEAATQNKAAVRTWEDPVFRAGATIADEAMRRDDGDIFYGVEQKLPLFGKPAAARNLAEAELSIEKANADTRFQTLRKDIAIAAFEAALAQNNALLAEQDFLLLQTLTEVAERRYENQTAGQGDVLRLQNERSRRLQLVRAQRVAATNSQVQLDRLVGRSFESLVPLQLPGPGPELVYSSQLIQLALRSEPTLKKMEREIERAAAAAEQTRRSRYPDLAVGLEGRNYSGSGEFTEGAAYVALNIPWGNRKKYEADYKREKARQAAAESEKRDYELEVGNEIHRLVTEANTALQEALLYRDEIIPRSRLAVESTRAAWESNAGSLLDLLDAQRIALEAELTFSAAVARQYELLSELVLCCGLGDLEALEMFAAPVPSSSNNNLQVR